MHRKLQDGVRELVESEPNDAPRAAVVETLRIIAEARARLEGAEAAWISRLDAQQIYEDDAHATAGICLQHEWRVSRSTANARVRRARELRDLPATHAALLAGRISMEHARELIGAMNPRTYTAMLEDEAAFCTIAAYLPFDEFRAKVAEWSRLHDPDGDIIKGHDASTLSLATGFFGRLIVNGDFCAEDAAVIRPILMAEGDRIWNQESSDRELDADVAPFRSSIERHAEAFVNLLVCANGRADAQMSCGPQGTVAIVTTPEDLAHETGGSIIDDRSPVDDEFVKRFCCDSALYRTVLRNGSEAIELGVAIRTAPPPLKRLLAVRDGGCVVPGCDRPPKWCEAHHVRWHSQGGATDIGNLVLLCRRHHQQLHKKKWHLSIERDQTVVITRPDASRIDRTARQRAPAGAH
jgi:hypothetical protein